MQVVKVAAGRSITFPEEYRDVVEVGSDIIVTRRDSDTIILKKTRRSVLDSVDITPDSESAMPLEDVAKTVRRVRREMRRKA